MPAKKKSSSKKVSSKRETIKPKGDARYIRRDSKGRIKESDDVGRSLKQDRQKKAKKTVSSGQGDKGDKTKAKVSRASKPSGGAVATMRRAMADRRAQRSELFDL